MAMEAIVNTILGHVDGQRDWSALNQNLKLQEPALTSAQNQPSLLPSLSQLQPHTHSLGVLHLLNALIKSNFLASQPQTLPEFLDYTSNFLGVCDSAQVRIVPEMFSFVCKKYKDYVIASGNPRRGILALRAALRALQGDNTELLTPIHADFFQLCLLAKVYNAAAEVLHEDIFDVDPARSAATPTDLFLYSYYGGLLLLGLKDYARSLELFLTALTAPATVGNAIVVACYKKYVLASLIHQGSFTPLPKFTSSRVKQVVESEGKAYSDLATAYSSHNPDKLRKVLDSHGQAYAADNNIGLVKLVHASLTKRNIQRLTQTYLSLSLQDIASQVGLASADEAEMHLLRMVSAGEIHAVIAGTMVRFLEGREQYNTAAMLERMDGCMQRCMALNKRLGQAHEAVSTDRAYLSKAFNKDRSSRYDVAASGGTGSGIEDFVGGSQGL